MTATPTENSTNIELLECIDDALRNGSNMTRANLAFDYLLERLGHARDDLPSYRADLHDQDHDERCCREHGTHSNPHVGCILR